MCCVPALLLLTASSAPRARCPSLDLKLSGPTSDPQYHGAHLEWVGADVDRLERYASERALRIAGTRSEQDEWFGVSSAVRLFPEKCGSLS